MHILLIEDNPVIIDALFKGLNEVTMHVLTTLLEARAYLIDHHPDMILLDLGLPDSRGLDTLRSLADIKIPKVIITTAQVAQGAADLDAFGYVIKGTGVDLVETVRFSIGKIAQKARPRFAPEVFEQLKACLMAR